MEQKNIINRFLDETGKIKQLPEKNTYRIEVLGYLAKNLNPIAIIPRKR
ncbi:hypothetical protein [Anaerotignum sp.]|nr:hypothetical protein [Anaerotignum sp.]